MNDKKSPLSREAMLLRTARRITSLETRQRALRRELAEVAGELKTRRRELRALAQVITERDPMSPPMRVYGEH